jgi:hypothetical protein
MQKRAKELYTTFHGNACIGLMLTQLTTERTILFVEIYKLKKLKVCEK